MEPGAGPTFRVLGEVLVERAGEVVEVPAHKPRLLLALLALHANQVVAAEWLMDRLWPEDLPSSARTLLHGYVADLRRRLEPERPRRTPATIIQTRSPGYVLVCDPAAVDVIEFERLTASAQATLRDGDAEEARALLTRALDLWQGPPFGSLADQPALAGETARLAQLRLAAIEGRMAADLALGRDAELVDELEGLVAQHPLRERLWTQLMLALYRSGRQADALAAYQRATRLLREELGIHPGPELAETERAILRQEAAAVTPAASSIRTTRPPPRPLTDFVGREGQLRALLTHLDDRRLVTLTGPGGCGKTRIAVELAWSMADIVPVAWVDLAPVRDPGQVASAAAAALGLVEHPRRDALETLIAQVGQQPLLLVLDNCEHLLDGCRALAAALLEGCPALRILATGRAPLGLPGELRWATPPLSLPPETSDLDEIAGAESVRLFVARAEDHQAAFAIDSRNAAHIAAICRRVDGIPLAIELAAAWTALLDPDQIRAKLDDPLAFLTRGSPAAPDRQQTLRSAIAWSFDLLPEPRQALFCQLSVFAGAFTLDAATRVCHLPAAGGQPVHGHREAITAGLADLEAASLVVADHVDAAAVRFHLLNTVRQFGAERLQTTGDDDVVHGRHAAYVLQLAQQAGRGLYRPEMREWLERLDTELDEVRAALDWMLFNDRPDDALETAALLLRYWMTRAHISEGRRWLDRGLSAEGGRSPAARVRALLADAFLACIHYDLDGARERATAARDLATGHPIATIWANNYLGLAATMDGDAKAALARHREALHTLDTIDEPLSRGWTLNLLALAHQVAGAYEDERAVLEDSLRLFREVGDPAGTEWALGYLGSATAVLGDPDSARELLTESLRIARAIGDRWGLARSLAAQAVAAGPTTQARHQLQESLDTFGHLGDRAGVRFCLHVIATWTTAEHDRQRTEELHRLADTIGADLRHAPVLGHLDVVGDGNHRDDEAAGPPTTSALITNPTIEEAVEAGSAALRAS